MNFKPGDIVEVVGDSREATRGAVGQVVDGLTQMIGSHNYIRLRFKNRDTWQVEVDAIKRVGSRLFRKTKPLTTERGT